MDHTNLQMPGTRADEAARRASRAVLREFEEALSLRIRGGEKERGLGDGFKVALGKLKGEPEMMDTA